MICMWRYVLLRSVHSGCCMSSVLFYVNILTILFEMLALYWILWFWKVGVNELKPGNCRHLVLSTGFSQWGCGIIVVCSLHHLKVETDCPLGSMLVAICGLVRRASPFMYCSIIVGVTCTRVCFRRIVVLRINASVWSLRTSIRLAEQAVSMTSRLQASWLYP